MYIYIYYILPIIVGLNIMCVWTKVFVSARDQTTTSRDQNYIVRLYFTFSNFFYVYDPRRGGRSEDDAAARCTRAVSCSTPRLAIGCSSCSDAAQTTAAGCQPAVSHCSLHLGLRLGARAGCGRYILPRRENRDFYLTEKKKHIFRRPPRGV